MASIEIVPEYQTGVGNLDFMFVGIVKDRGIVKLCAEFKPAHSTDVFRGLEIQLPTYMRNKEVQYGAYCILGFKGQWFENPRDKSLDDLFHELQIARIRQQTPESKNIRVFMYDLSKPESASKHIRPPA